jgi:putative flippase GtrA
MSAKHGRNTAPPTVAECASRSAFNPRRVGSGHALGREVLGYGLVSAIALVVDTATLRTLVVICGWHYLLGSVVAFIAGAVVAYILSVEFVFRCRRVNNRTLEFGYFLVLGAVGLIVNAGALSVAITGIGLSLLKAKACAAACTFTCNFVLRRSFLFSPKRSFS